MLNKGLCIPFAGSLALAVCAAPACAQAPASGAARGYPAKPVRVLVPFSAGSATDILARLIGPRLHETWGQQIVVDNRPSAGGTVAGSIVANAAPDGYTLLMTSSAFAGSAALYDKLPYDTVRDFAPITQIASTPLLIVVGPSLGVKTLKELIALAKQKPRQLNFASSGIGSGTHYGSELFNYTAGISAVHVPYKGVPEGMNDTLSGRSHYFMAPILPAMPLIKSGRLLALGVSTAQRTPLLPDVPTVAQAALPGFAYEGWYGLIAPAKTPAAILLTLHREVGRVLETAEVRERVAALGGTVKTSTPEQFARLIGDEIVTRRKIFRAAGVRPG